MRVARPTRPLYLLLGLALVVLALWGFWPRPTLVEVASVVRGPLTVTFTEEGRTRLRDRYVVSAPLDGFVERITLEPGDPVKAGALVAVIRPTHAALFDPAARAEADARRRAAMDELAAADAEVAAAMASLTRLEAARRRAETLARDQLVARDQLDEIRAQAEAAQASVRNAQAQSRAARVRRDAARAVLALQGSASETGPRLSVRAPIDGRVIRRQVESESTVRAGQVLLELGDPRALEVVVEVLTQDAMRLSPGMPVRLLRWGGSTPLQGAVVRVEPGGFTKVSALGVEEQRVLVVVSLPATQGPTPLGDGFRVEAEFQAWHSGDALAVPVAALFRDGDDWATYVVERGRARLRRVRIGQMAEAAAEVSGGLEESAVVVLYPDDRLRDGMRVRASRSGGGG